MSDDATLLREYATMQAEPAFAALVDRHLDLVYFAALRRCRGDGHRAEEVTQQVFTALARNAASLAGHRLVAGWLYVATRNVAANLMRAEHTRRARETEAQAMSDALTPPSPADSAVAAADWEQLRPVLDTVMDELAEPDRDAVLLRFFESRPFGEIAAALRVTEDAARMRVARALEKLRLGLERRGITSTGAALATALASQAAFAKPVGLAASVTMSALLGSVATGGKAGAAVTIGSFGFVSAVKFWLGVAMIGGAATVGGVAAHQQASASRAELTTLEYERVKTQTDIAALERRFATAEQRAAGADGDATLLLKAIQDAAPKTAFPPGDAVCVAFVIDTSGSMRDPRTGKLWSAVHEAIRSALAAHPAARYVMGFDADGRRIFSERGGWMRLTSETPAAIEQLLQDYQQDTISNPVPGVYRAMRELPPANRPGAQLHVYVIGDEFNSSDDSVPVLRRLGELNPADPSGRRQASIHAMQLPTTIRLKGGPMGNTGLKFHSLMTEVARQHGGSFRLLPDTALP